MSTTWQDYGVWRVPNSISKLLFCATDPAHTPLYFADMVFHHGRHTERKADVTLHRLHHPVSAVPGHKLHTDEARESPIVGTAYFNRHSGGRIGLALGNPKDMEALVWESMRIEGRTGGRYVLNIPSLDTIARQRIYSKTLESDFPGTFSTEHTLSLRPTTPTTHKSHLITATTTTTPTTESKQYTWKRTHSLSSGLENHPLYRVSSAANWKLVDDATGEIVACFESNGLKSLKKRGRLRVRWSALGVWGGGGEVRMGRRRSCWR